jgi:hypothetical protein
MVVLANLTVILQSITIRDLKKHILTLEKENKDVAKPTSPASGSIDEHGNAHSG